MVIWKTVLQRVDVQQIEIPAGAEILLAREQIDHREQIEQVCVWYRCDPSAPLETRTIVIVGTGNKKLSADGRYLGTASLRGGQLMYHVFERQSTRSKK